MYEWRSVLGHDGVNLLDANLYIRMTIYMGHSTLNISVSDLVNHCFCLKTSNFSYLINGIDQILRNFQNFVQNFCTKGFWKAYYLRFDQINATKISKSIFRVCFFFDVHFLISNQGPTFDIFVMTHHKVIIY